MPLSLRGAGRLIQVELVAGDGKRPQRLEKSAKPSRLNLDLVFMGMCFMVGQSGRL